MTKSDNNNNNEQTQMTILVTGGAGYIGIHTVLLLLEQNYRVVVVDNCLATHMATSTTDMIGRCEQRDPNGNESILNGKGNSGLREFPESLRRVQELTGRQLAGFYRLDLVTDSLDEIFRRHQPIKAVIHFAALKCVSESIGMPLEYYTNNLIGSINLFNAMKQYGCKQLIFSSSATVYGLPEYAPVDERHETGRNLLNPYGRTKYMIEEILKDLCSKGPIQIIGQKQMNNHTSGLNHPSGNCWNIVSLRYFNPVGAHPSGYIGEHIQGIPNNLMPYISQVAFKKREKLYIYGNDFDTHDGTGVRDYIHIMDLASGHLHALEFLMKHANELQNQNRTLHNNNNTTLDSSSTRGGGNFHTFNLGTGRGYSVLETVKAFEQVNQVKVPYEFVGRRQGDAGEVYADVSLARTKLGWTSKRNLAEMVRDTYRWQTEYPEGFKTPAKPNAYVISRPKTNQQR